MRSRSRWWSLVIIPDTPDFWRRCLTITAGGQQTILPEVVPGLGLTTYDICYTHPADAAAITVELLLVLVIKQFALEAEILEEGKTLTILFPTES